MDAYNKKELIKFINDNKEIKETINQIKFFDGFNDLQNKYYKNLKELLCNDYNLYIQIIEII